MNQKISKQPVALTIAGSDSGGGAGIQADLKTFAVLGVYGTSVVTVLTAQNPAMVSGIQPVDPPIVSAQLKAVAEYFPVGGVKMGLLFSTEIISAVASSWKSVFLPGTPPPLVVDPVMVATSGAKLLKDSAIDTLIREILPLADLITPNLDEAEILSEIEIKNREDMEKAARLIADRFGGAVLVKGGHAEGNEVVDILFTGEKMVEFKAPRVLGVNTHGTGCTLSAAITARLAGGRDLTTAVGGGIEYLRSTITNPIQVGDKVHLNHSPRK